MQRNDNIPPPGGGGNLEGAHISKRDRDSPLKNPKAKKQTTISNYWLATNAVPETSNTNRFSILDTNYYNDIGDEPETEIQKPPPRFL